MTVNVSFAMWQKNTIFVSIKTHQTDCGGRAHRRSTLHSCVLGGDSHGSMEQCVQSQIAPPRHPRKNNPWSGPAMPDCHFTQAPQISTSTRSGFATRQQASCSWNIFLLTRGSVTRWNVQGSNTLGSTGFTHLRALFTLPLWNTYVRTHSEMV